MCRGEDKAVSVNIKSSVAFECLASHPGYFTDGKLAPSMQRTGSCMGPSTGPEVLEWK